MPASRRLWSSLATSTKARYRRAGITPQKYNSGKIPTDLRRRARGHAQTPERPSRAYTAKGRRQYQDYVARNERKLIQRTRAGWQTTGPAPDIPASARRSDAKIALIYVSKRGVVVESWANGQRKYEVIPRRDLPNIEHNELVHYVAKGYRDNGYAVEIIGTDMDAYADDVEGLLE